MDEWQMLDDVTADASGRGDPGLLTPIETSPGERIEAVLDSLWVRGHETACARVATIEAFISRLLAELPADDRRDAAIDAAHQLAGTLGTFRLPTGSEIAASIEGRIRDGRLGDDSLLDAAEQLERLRSLLDEARPGTTNAGAGAAGSRPTVTVIAATRALTESLVLEASQRGYDPQPGTVEDLANSADAPAAVMVDGADVDSAAVIARRATSGGARVIAFAVPQLTAARAALYDAGVDLILSSPVAPSEIVDALDRVLRSRPDRLTAVLVTDSANPLSGAEDLWPSLEHYGVHPNGVARSDDLWKVLADTKPDVILLDGSSTRIDPALLCRVVRSEPAWGPSAVVVLLASGDPTLAQHLLTAGADDCVVAPFDAEGLAARLHHRVARLRRQSEVSDPVTELPTRGVFAGLIGERLDGNGDGATPVSILYASLPDLRATNDICGYAAGDRLLRRMADVVRASFRPYDLTGRWAGNGVVVGLPGVPRADAIIRAGALAQSLVDVGLSSCVGWATGPDDGTDVETLVLTARRRGGMASPAPATQRDERRILVVEDDDVIVGLLKELLTAEGHHVHVVGDGVEASELLSDDGAPDRFSLVLLDISLPGIDGFGVLRRMSVAGTSQRVPVILLSARSRADEVTLGLELGAVDHVAKPFSLPVLLQKVKRALDVHDPR